MIGSDAFTDGRDTIPKAGWVLFRNWNRMAATAGQIVSITSRYYAMDRDKRWERVKANTLVHGTVPPDNLTESIRQS